MKKLYAALILLLCLNVAGQEKEKKMVSFTPRPPTTTPVGSVVLPRIQERNSFDSIFESKPASSKCFGNCICAECLEKACCELDKIQSKLPLIEIALKKSKESRPVTQEITIARMMAKVVALHKESQRLELVCQRAKEASKAEKKSSKVEKKAEVSDFKLKKSSNFREGRLTTQGDYSDDEQYNQLTDETQENYRWRFRQASAGIV